MNNNILGMQVNITSIDKSIQYIGKLTQITGGSYICVSNVHMCMESFYDKSFQSIVNNANYVVPDGKPIVWAQKLLGTKNAEQVRGMDLMHKLCEFSETNDIKVGFYGGTEELLEILKQKILSIYPYLQVPILIAPPFRPLTSKEDFRFIKTINESDVKILFVGLGCPKQERWMSDHVDKINCVMLGVGAAFDFIAGNKPHAPRWMQELGMEWLFRLMCEPKRLFKRYLKYNPLFVYYFVRQLLGEKYDV